MAVFCPLSTQPVFFQGQAQIGALIQVFDAGTLTPRTAYKDGLLGSVYAQPIPTDANGCFPRLWVQGNPYKVRLTTAGGVQIREVDNLPGDAVPGSGPGGGGGTLATGDLQWNYGTAVIAGRVRANGKTIGNAASGGTELASATCQNLFVWLWNGDPNLPVSGGRGTSALTDFSANKTITLPDFNGRAPFGIDGMGASASWRFNGLFFSSGSAGVLGSTGGFSLITLDATQIPSHQHTGTTQSAGNHQHTGTTATESATHTHGATTDAQGAHNHSGSLTDSQGNHTHSYTGPSTTNANAAGAIGGYWNGAISANTGTAGAHSHNLSIVTDGSHAHNVTVGTQSASHTHAFTSGTESAGHTHSFTSGAESASHNHSFVTDAGGVHTHSFTCDATGGGAAHGNMPPFILVTFYLVL